MRASRTGRRPPASRHHGAFAVRIASLGLALAAGPAAAMMAPHYYEKARQEAPSVIVITVETVTGPGPEGYGDCLVKGHVLKVERGSAYKAGQAVSLGVPCARPGPNIPIGGTIWQDPDRLKASRYGRAYLNAEGGVVLSQYYQLEAP